ncbi:MAG: DUF2147 domain-containing protein [Proteobacteria bacterium]|nr:DUF2147 domain-containing protein [Pseudomonadota bacterium]
MRVTKYIAPLAVAFSLTPALLESASAASDPTGVWMNDTGRGAIKIETCGNALCGNVVWVKSSADADGCGKQIIGDVKPVGGGRWDNGWIFSPEKGRKYDVELTPLSNGNLKVVGYAGLKFLSKTMIWKPAPQDLQLCGAGDTEKKPDITAAAPADSAAPKNDTPATSAPAPAKEAAAPDAKAAANTEQAKAPPASPDQAKTTPETKSANADPAAPADENGDTDSGKGNDIAGALGKLKIGDLSLDKVLTKTKSGKCKLDLPWFKVTIDCEQH